MGTGVYPLWVYAMPVGPLDTRTDRARTRWWAAVNGTRRAPGRYRRYTLRQALSSTVTSCGKRVRRGGAGSPPATAAQRAARGSRWAWAVRRRRRGPAARERRACPTGLNRLLRRSRSRVGWWGRARRERPVAGARVGAGHLRRVCRPRASLPRGAHGGGLGATGPRQESVPVAVLVDGTPGLVSPTIEPDTARVRVPLVTGARPAAARDARVGLAARPAPAPDGCGGRHDAPRGAQPHASAVAAGVPGVRPHGVRAALGREATPLVGGGGCCYLRCLE